MNILEITELYTLNMWIMQHVIYISIKLFFKRLFKPPQPTHIHEHPYLDRKLTPVIWINCEAADSQMNWEKWIKKEKKHSIPFRKDTPLQFCPNEDMLSASLHVKPAQDKSDKDNEHRWNSQESEFQAFSLYTNSFQTVTWQAVRWKSLGFQHGFRTHGFSALPGNLESWLSDQLFLIRNHILYIRHTLYRHIFKHFIHIHLLFSIHQTLG